MGWCSEFGALVREGCAHPMRAGATSCSCVTCGAVCNGKFAGCQAVWAAGPREIRVVHPVVPVAAGRDDRSVRTAGLGQRPVTGEGPEGWDFSGGTASQQLAAPVVAVTAGERVAGTGAEEADGAKRQREVPVPVGAPGAGRAEVLSWLHEAFESVRGELRALRASLDGAHHAIVALAPPEPDSFARLAALVEGLPAQVETAAQQGVRAALRDARRDGSPVAAAGGPDDDDGSRERARRLAEQLRHSLAEVHQAAADLREEMVRLASFREALAQDLPAVARAVDSAYKRADTRLADLATRVDSLAGTQGWQRPVEPVDAREVAEG